MRFACERTVRTQQGHATQSVARIRETPHMAPFTHDSDLLDEISDLSPQHQRIVRAGVRGGDGPEDTPDGGNGDEVPAEGGDAAPPADPAPEGGDAPAGDGDAAGDGEGDAPASPEASIPALPADLTVEPVESLQALYAEIETARDALLDGVRGQAELDAVQEATNRRTQIRAEISRRIDDAQRVRQQAESVRAEIEAEDALPEVEGLVLASATPAPPSAAQIASARGVQPASAQQSPTPTRQRPRAALTANIGGDNAQIGQHITDADLAEMLDRTKHSAARTIVAALPAYTEMGPNADVGMILGQGSPEQNSAMMREIRETWAAGQRAVRDGQPLDARTAAICEPLDIRREIPDAFNTNEPIRGIFPNSPATRLGFQYFRSVGLADVSGAVNVWTETLQGDVDPDTSSTWKPCLEIDCPSAQSIKAEAIVACLLWDLTMEMSNPENLANLRNALNALRARIKEGKILQRIDANSSHYTHDGDYGAVPTLIEALNTAMAIGGFVNRLEDETYTAILPPGAVAVLLIDLVSRGFEGFGVTDALGYVRDRVAGVGQVVMSLDASLSGEPSLPFPALNPVGDAADPLPSLNDTYRVRLLDPSAAIYSETGQLNMGTTADSQLLRQNKTQFFQEEFLLLAKQGPQPWFAIDVDLCANGARAGWVTPTTCSFS